MILLARFIVLPLGAATVVLLVLIVRDILRKMSGSGLILFGALAGLFLGERVLGDGSWRLPISGIATIALLASGGLRIFAWQRSEGNRKSAHAAALGMSGLVVGALALYALTSQSAVSALGLAEEAASRWTGAWSAIWPIVLTLGVLPTFLLDRALASHPVQLPMGATRQATMSGLATALAICLVFPVNYLAASHPWTHDAAYFQTARPGDATESMVGTLSEPVTAYLFYPPASEVREELLTYFTPLADASAGQITVKVVDQPLVPALAEQLKVRENGYVVLSRGEGEDLVSQKFKVGAEMKKAKRELKKLDATLQKNLLKLTRDERVVYLTVGHGEASAREKDDLLKKLNLFKQLVQSQNYKVKDLGVAEGLAAEIPDDASVVIIAAPEVPLSPEVNGALLRYLDGGGSLMLLLDPGADPLTQLATKLGVTSGDFPLAHAEQFIPQKRGDVDRGLLFSNRFGSHASVKTLSKNSAQLGLILPTTLPIEKDDSAPGKRTTVIRSFPDTWAETNGNYQHDPFEPGKVFDIGVAIDGPEETPYRALVIGDVSVFADPVIKVFKGNQQLAFDSMRWLVGDDDIEGSVESEEDVKIQHTKGEDVWYFYLTGAGVPVLILVLGALVIRLRRRKS